MSLLKKLFGSEYQATKEHTNFQEGDIFYIEKEDKYRIFKLLKYDNDFETFHVTAYEEVITLPGPNEVKNLKIRIHHLPVAKTGFEKPKLITNNGLNDYDLIGYFEYLKEIQNIYEIAKYAEIYYQEAFELSNQEKHQAAIKKYTKAIDLLPNLYEAIDNRAFCHMDLGNWKEAIVGFNQSLKVNPNSLLAIFSIGECYLQLKKYPKAKEYFQRAIKIDPNYLKSKEFLEMTEKLMNE